MNQILIVNISSLLIIIILSIVVLIKSNKNKLVMYLAIFTIIIGVGSLTYCLINSISNDGYKVINLNTNKNFNAFEDYFWHKKKKLKDTLRDQKFVSGLGNIYVNEILFLIGF